MVDDKFIHDDSTPQKILKRLSILVVPNVVQVARVHERPYLRRFNKYVM